MRFWTSRLVIVATALAFGAFFHGTDALATPVTSNLVLWLDGDDLDGDGVAEGAGEDGISGGLVTTWVDKAAADGAQTAVQGSAGNQPAFLLSGFNGRPILKFDGSNDFMKTAPFTAPIAQPMTIFAVWKVDDLSTTNYIAYDGLSSSSRVLLVNENVAQLGGSQIGFFAGSFLLANYTPFSAAPNTPIINTSIHNSPNSALWQDGGVLQSGNDTGPHSLDGLTLGGRFSSPTPANYLKGALAEVLVYDAALGTDDRLAVEAYLTQKWVPEPSSAMLLIVGGLVLWFVPARRVQGRLRKKSF